MTIYHRVTQSIAKLFVISLAVVLLGCDTEEETTKVLPSVAAPPTTITGSLDVYYSVQTSETEGVSSGNTPYKASAIYFYDEYIIVESADGGGRLFPIDKIKTFSWGKRP
ncbi:MAG: hypothetical protein PF495_17560 [Spirochaetales bacterium]|jgi:hypothetical protein|nr:hypothetical protein [Spirochaetales bacterium]